MHDFVHGVFHLDKGFLFTLKELFTRPGHSIREYIQGKRADHFNYFTFIILLVTVGHILSSYSTMSLSDLTPAESKEMMNAVQKFSKEYPKLYSLSTIPALALFSFLFFRRSKQNYTEHLVLETFKMAAIITINMLLTLAMICYPNITFLTHMMWIFQLLTTAYSAWFYYQYFSVFGYTKRALLTRSIFASLSPFLLGIIIGIVMASVMIVRMITTGTVPTP